MATLTVPVAAEPFTGPSSPAREVPGNVTPELPDDSRWPPTQGMIAPLRTLPTGTVTFLFTDIEGSTRVLRELGDRYITALAEHRQILREAFTSRGGVEVDNQGDAFFFAFSDAGKAVEAARAAQAQLEHGVMRVRMGLHTGEPKLSDDGYVGIEVHRAARIAAAGHGGQVVLSRSTLELVADVDASDLGQHQIKDFDEPVWLFQIGHEAFPPLKTVANTNLPRPAQAFVGRAGEPLAVAELMKRNRFVTLTGPGGSGKTRLAIEAASELVGDFIHGSFWVDVSSIRDPSLVAPAISQAMGYRGDLAREIGEKHIMLVLDNMEHVLGAAPAVAALVEACRNLRMLVTSRAPLSVRGEIEYRVEPLDARDAVDLFCLRAQVPTSIVVQELCRRLDNMPLAVELAAARARVLSPAQILERLGKRLDMLRGGREAEPRHSSLRATLDWSYALLDPPARALFERLAVFAGGCTLEAAEEVCDADIDDLQSLVESSLVRFTDARFAMLETIRQYAAELFAARRDAHQTRARHAQWVLAFARALDVRGDQGDVFSKLRAELPNVRVALHELDSSGAASDRLTLVTALSRSMFQLGATNESRSWMEEALSASEGGPAELRARALVEASMDSSFSGNPDAGARHARAAAKLASALNDAALRSDVYLALGIAEIGGRDFEAADLATRRALEIAEDVGDASRIADLRNNLAYISLAMGNPESAREAAEAALAEQIRRRNYHCASTLHMNLSLVAIAQNAPRDAVEHLTEGLRLSTTHKLESVMCALVETTGAIAAAEGEHGLAATLLGASEKPLRTSGPIEDELRLTTASNAMAALGDREFADQSARGAELSIEGAAALAMEWLIAKKQ